MNHPLVITVHISPDDPAKHLTLAFEVRCKTTQTVLHRRQASAPSRMAWSLNGLGNNTVQLDRSDIGPCGWRRAGPRDMDGSTVPLIVWPPDQQQREAPSAVFRGRSVCHAR